MRKSWLIGGAGLIAVVAVVTAVAVTQAKPAPNAHAGEKSEPALQFGPGEVTHPALASMPLRIEFSGPLVAPSTAIVRAKAAGTLLSLAVNEGSRVHAGQTLGQIDLSELDAKIAERRAMLESAKAQLVQAERTHAANVKLANEKFISPNALENSQAALETARAQLRAAQAQLDTLQVNLRNAALVTPISGVVAKRHVVPGEKLALEQEVLTIVDLQTLELNGMVGTHEVSRLAPGMPVEVRVEGVDAPVHGKIARIAPAADPGTRSIGVVVTIANPKEVFRAGQYAVARAEVPDPAQRLTLPIAAIANTSGQDNVWLIDHGELLRRAVTTGRRDDAAGRIEVLQGLDGNAQVLAARFDNLREGSKAVVLNQKPAQAVASAASMPHLK
jgi:RND family efflux transporter MFP subunit